MGLAIDSTTYRTPNYWRRGDGTPYRMTPRGLLIHTGEGRPDAQGRSWQSDIPWLCMVGSGASCHYYVTRRGTVFQLADDTLVTWHGAALNWSHLGIENEHRAGQDWPDIQVEALSDLCRHLIAKWKLAQDTILPHHWTSPADRRDPTDWSDAFFLDWRTKLYL